jgi:hypothetical protein
LISSVVLLGIALVVPGFADTVIASGAGPLPATAEDLSGDLSLSEITGALDYPDGVSMFKIDILYPVDFSAQTVPVGAFGVPDTELFLFDSSGLGVYMNDDITASDTLSCLPSSDSNNPCPSPSGGLGPLTAGIYYLAIAYSADLPLDSSSTDNFLSSVLSTDVVGPDPTAGAVAGWDNGVYTSPDYDLVNYDIQITDAPEPAAWTLIAVVAAFVLFRRRQWAAHPPQ